MAYTTINKPSEYFNTLLYSGDGSSPRNLTGVGFQPDFTWIKQRSSTNTHVLWDAVRTAGADKEISTASTSAEGGQQSSLYGYLSSFDSDGFTATTGSTNIGWVNNSGQTYVSWNWLANGSGTSNTDGDITSTVSANQTSGFSIVKYVNPASGSPFTVGHGLGSELKCVITKNLSASQTWGVWHTGIGFGNYIRLDSNVASAAANLVTATSSTTFSSYSAHHSAGVDLIAYCFAEKKGFSKFGYYTGNGNANGPFVYTGFKPAFVLVKNATVANNWFLQDNQRAGYNGANYLLKPNLSDQEDAGTHIDILSNGFKTIVSSANCNGSGNNIIYMAFAENPLVGTNNIPACAR